MQPIVPGGSDREIPRTLVDGQFSQLKFSERRWLKNNVENDKEGSQYLPLASTHAHTLVREPFMCTLIIYTHAQHAHTHTP